METPPLFLLCCTLRTSLLPSLLPEHQGLLLKAFAAALPCFWKFPPPRNAHGSLSSLRRFTQISPSWGSLPQLAPTPAPPPSPDPSHCLLPASFVSLQGPTDHVPTHTVLRLVCSMSVSCHYDVSSPKTQFFVYFVCQYTPAKLRNTS